MPDSLQAGLFLYAYDNPKLDPVPNGVMGRTSSATLAPGAVAVWEENAPQPAPASFETLDQRRYGETWITILRAV